MRSESLVLQWGTFLVLVLLTLAVLTLPRPPPDVVYVYTESDQTSLVWNNTTVQVPGVWGNTTVNWTNLTIALNGTQLQDLVLVCKATKWFAGSSGSMMLEWACRWEVEP